MSVDPTSLLNDDLRTLRGYFQANGFDIRLVGGCVRDLLYNIIPHDIDLCTNADPIQQISLYELYNIRYIKTGLAHGTISVWMNGTTYEITSLRTDIETDGRHAKVEYTSDWYTDLARRDFTINAMNLDFDGNLLDPFDGQSHLKDGAVRFVGDPYKRIKEDYLRILRWYRFRGRFDPTNVSIDERTAIRNTHKGLERISKERIWSELQKILPTRYGTYLMQEMNRDILQSCGFTYHYQNSLSFHVLDLFKFTSNPITHFVSCYKSLSADYLKMLKASNNDIHLAQWLSDNYLKPISPFTHIAVNNINREWAVELAALKGMDQFNLAILLEWDPPEFPVNGFDLIKLGMTPGPHYGIVLLKLKEKWANSNYVLDKEDLLKEVDNLLKSIP